MPTMSKHGIRTTLMSSILKFIQKIGRISIRPIF